MEALRTFLVPLGRLLMSSIFIWEGVAGLRNPAGVVHYYAHVHVPAPDIMVWVVGIFQLVFGLAFLAGFGTRWVAAALAAFCLITAFGVHLPAGSLADMTHFYKNLVMAGGFLYAVSCGPGGIGADRAAGTEKD